MAHIKVLGLLIALFIVSGKSNPRIHHQGKHTHHDGTPDLLHDIKDNQNCICFEKNQPLVTDLLSQNGGRELKRLVLYLYKSSNDDNVQLYAPNKEKQALFPDLGHELGDDFFIVGTKTIGQVFEDNKNVIDVNKQQTHSKENTNQAILSETSFDHGDKISSLNKPLFSVTVPTGNALFPTDPTAENILEESMTDLEENSNEINNEIILAPEPHTESMTKIDNNDRFIPVGEKESPSQINENNNAFSQEMLTPTVKAQLHSQSSKDHIHSFKIDDDILPIQLSDSQQNKVSKNLLDQVVNSESVSGSKYTLPTIAIEDYFMTDISQSGIGGPYNQLFTAKYLTFDKWFDQQMQRWKNTDQPPKKNIDLSSLKSLVEKTLYDNGLLVTKDGVLTDSKANALNVANLKLRPILIGDSVAYNSLFDLKDGGKYELPSDLPYLEAVLVTLGFPPKILGVIPLGKTFVPRESYRSEFDYWAWRARNNRNKCVSWDCKQAKQRHYYESHTVNSQRSANQYKSRNPPSTSRNIKIATPAVKISQEKGRQGNLDRILNAIQEIIGIRPNKAHVPVTQKPEVKGDTGIPGFRIIGGFPATGSGTPVSNKGRSGNMYT